MKIRLYQLLESLFSAIETAAAHYRELFAICPDCGRNRYSGKPCKGGN